MLKIFHAEGNAVVSSTYAAAAKETCVALLDNDNFRVEETKFNS